MLRGLRGENSASSSRRWGHPGVLSLAALRSILTERAGCLGEDTWSLTVRKEATDVVARMVVGCASSKHLSEGAPVGAHWLLTLQLLTGALHCLRLLWPSTPATVDAAEPFPLPIELDELLPILATQICGTQALLQRAASELLAHIVGSSAADVLPAALSALTDAVLDLPPTARDRRREALQQVSPLIDCWLATPRVARSLAPCVDRMQALGLLLFIEACPRLRGEAAQLLLLLSPIATTAADQVTRDEASAEARSLCDAEDSLSVASTLIRSLPMIIARALSDPLQLDLWNCAGGSRTAQQAAERLRAAAEKGCLRGFAEATGDSEGELQLWLACLHGCAHALARAGAGCVLALRAAWPMLIQRCPRASPSTSVPALWAPCASLATACASVVLSDDSSDTLSIERGPRFDVERLLRDAVRLLLCDQEGHRTAAAAVLGQLRGGAAVQLVLSELQPPLHQATGDSEWARHALKNTASRVHVQMRMLAHVLSLLSVQEDWANLLTTCGAPLNAMSHWLSGVLDYLSLPFNLHAWSLQRARKYAFDLLARSTPSLLSALASHGNASQRANLRPSAVLSTIASLLEASASESAAQALDGERARLIQRTKDTDAAVADTIITRELQAQADAVQVAALRALAALATPEAFSSNQSETLECELPLACAEALLQSTSHSVAQAARDALQALWAACQTPIRACLERCYRSNVAAVANAHFIALVAVALRTSHPSPSLSEGSNVSGSYAPASVTSSVSLSDVRVDCLALDDEHRVPLMVLSFCKLADPSPQVRAAAERLLHAQGGAADSEAPPPLIAEGLPWGAEWAHVSLSHRLSASNPHLAAAVVRETLNRAAVAPLALAQMMMHILPPWVECAALELLSTPTATSHPSHARGPAAGSTPKHAVRDLRSARVGPQRTLLQHSEVASETAPSLQHELLQALIFHAARGHAPLALPLHQLWRAAAAREACVRPIIGFLLEQVRTRVTLSGSLNATGRAAGASSASSPDEDASMPPNPSASAQTERADQPHAAPVAAESAAAHRSAAAHEMGVKVLRACQAAILAISSAQPASSARLLAQQLAPSGCTSHTAGELGIWPTDVSPREIAGASNPTRDPLPSFAPPVVAAVTSYRAESFPRGGSHFVGLNGVSGALSCGDGSGASSGGLCGEASSATTAATALGEGEDHLHRTAVRCSHAEAALLLLAACSEEALTVLVADADILCANVVAARFEPVAGQPPPPSHPPPPSPPPRGDLLGYTLHTAILVRTHGREALPTHAGRLLARIISVSERHCPGGSEVEHGTPPPASRRKPRSAGGMAGLHRSQAAESRVDRSSEGVAVDTAVDSPCELMRSLLQPTRPPPFHSAPSDHVAARTTRGPPSCGDRDLMDSRPNEHASKLKLARLVRSLVGILCTRERTPLADAWARCALRHGCNVSALRRAGHGENAVTRRCSLAVYTAMVPALPPGVLRPHVRTLLDAACCCALHPSTQTVALATEAALAVKCALALVSPASSQAELLADVVWRAALLMHADIVPLYQLGVDLIMAVVQLRPLSDGELGEALRKDAPPCFLAVDSGLDFCGLQPLLLRGLGRRETRDDCLSLMRHAAACGPTPNAFLEVEATRLLTCAVSLLPYLCEQSIRRHEEALAPPTPFASAARGRSGRFGAGSARPEVDAAHELANACVDAAKDTAARPGRRELLPIASVLHNYATSQYDQVARFLHSMREAIRKALSPHSPSVVYTALCALICGVGAAPSCWAELLQLVHWLLEQFHQRPPACHELKPAHSGALGSLGDALPVQHLWRTAIEISLDVPMCASSLASAVEALLGACSVGVLQPFPSGAAEQVRASMLLRLSTMDRMSVRSLGDSRPAVASPHSVGSCDDCSQEGESARLDEDSEDTDEHSLDSLSPIHSSPRKGFTALPSRLRPPHLQQLPPRPTHPPPAPPAPPMPTHPPPPPPPRRKPRESQGGEVLRHAPGNGDDRRSAVVYDNTRNSECHFSSSEDSSDSGDDVGSSTAPLTPSSRSKGNAPRRSLEMAGQRTPRKLAGLTRASTTPSLPQPHTVRMDESDSATRNGDDSDRGEGNDINDDDEHDDEVVLQLNPALWVNEGSGRRSQTRRNRIKESRQDALRNQVRRMSSGLLMRSL